MPSTLINVVRDSLFPPLCYGCKSEILFDVPLCGRCSAALHSEWKTICPVCSKEKTFLQIRRCSHAPAHLSTLSYITLYSHPTVRGLIHTFKYSGIRKAVYPFGDLIEKERVNLLRIPADVVVPLPLHPRKKRERGFNQTEEIASYVSKTLALPIKTDILLRRRAASPQARNQNRKDRKKNVQGIFKVSNSFEKGLSILLIDDVATSGATLEEAAKVLLQGGAHSVHAFTLAREE